MARLRNPYLELWNAQRKDIQTRTSEVLRALLARDEDQLKRLKQSRSRHTHVYAYAIPTQRAIVTISRFAPIVEIGAGTGYWAWLLRQIGTDIVCYDSRPPTADSDENRFHTASKCWTEVLRGNETALDEHPSRTLFLCWPPAGDAMAFRALKRYGGEVFLYVGEMPLANEVRACTGDDQFFQLLSEHWAPAHSVALPKWEFCWDRLYVFSRRDLREKRLSTPCTDGPV